MLSNEIYNLQKFKNTEWLKNVYLKQISSYNRVINIHKKALVDTTEEVLESIKSDIARIENNKRRVEYSITTINDECEHDFILYLGKKNIQEQNTGYAMCLSCERVFYLNESNKEISIEDESVINITGIIPDKYICNFNEYGNILVKRARQKILLMAALKEILTYEEVKACVLEDLVSYINELEYREIKPRTRKRVLAGIYHE